MKMFGFVLMALVIGGAIAAYIKLPRDDNAKFVIKTAKFVLGVMILTLITTFVFAIIGSTISIKLF